MSESDSYTESSARVRSRRRQTHNPRLRMACLRCRQKKIKCDTGLPQCRNCLNAGLECVAGEGIHPKESPRACISTLKDRVKWLEDIIRDKCPDIDLSQGPGSGDVRAIITTAPPPTQPQAISSNTVVQNESRIACHDIGLVSLGVSQDPRYIGPSSGHFLARIMLTKGSQTGTRNNGFFSPTDLIQTVQSPADLPSREIADQICNAFFEALHPIYPVLHRPTFVKMLDQIYTTQDAEPAVQFQVYMVLAIGSLVASQKFKARLLYESYCLSALYYFDSINIENSLQGLQCLLLLLIFTLHSPYIRINIWYLNYQAIAAVIDLGLQKDVSAQPGISMLDQELRSRIFWVVYMMDKVIATTMGRPIGLRYEVYDLNLPRELDDLDLGNGSHSNPALKPISFSIHLFRLAKLNSEIKHIISSAIRQTPAYAYPAVTDICEWQIKMLKQIDHWEETIPPGDGSPTSSHLSTICCIQGHILRMVLLRPSPAIPQPIEQAFTKCRLSASKTLELLNKLYIRNTLLYSWLTFHAVVLSTLTLLYCVETDPEVRKRTEIPDLMSDLSIASSLLCATGEHWSGAKRCRDILDKLGRSVVQKLMSMPSEVDSTNTIAHTPMVAPSAFFDDFLGSGSLGVMFMNNESSNVDERVQSMF